MKKTFVAPVLHPGESLGVLTLGFESSVPTSN